MCGLIIVYLRWIVQEKMGVRTFVYMIFQVSKKGKDESLSFYSLPEFEEWKKATPNWNKWITKYYKGVLHFRIYFRNCLVVQLSSVFASSLM